MIDPARWDEVKSLVLQALDLPRESHTTFLNEACGDDEALRNAVSALLAVSTQEADAFDQAHIAFPGLSQTELPEGTIVDHYRIIRSVGQGAMGIVYLADDLKHGRSVALKILSPRGMHFSRSEHRLLARLNHPNIASLYDSGTTEDGRTYLAMEYIDGEPLSLYCEKHCPTRDSRLTLFVSICDAVAYAHQHLIVHRDLKPSNILVTKDGVPKIIDFGVAKRIPPDILTTRTDVAQNPFTVAFASPEQLRKGETATTADIYSLGVLLCVLLTGFLPYRGADPLDLYSAIPSQDPDKPSSLAGASPQGDRQPRFYIGPPPPEKDLEHLTTLLRGDIDAIVLKALRKEPDKRYQTVADLTADIRHALNDEPVSARDGSTRYVAQKFLKRHALGVVTATCVSFAFIILLSGLFYQWRQALHERDTAQANQERAETITQFLVDLFDRSSAWSDTGPTQTPEQFIDDATRRLGQNLRTQPQLKARLLNTLGEIYTRLGSYEKAEPLLQTALTLQRASLGRNPLDISETLNALGYLRLEQGRYAESEALFLQSLTIAKQYAETRPNSVANRLSNLSAVKRHQGKFVEAEHLAREALALCEAHPTETHKHLDNVLRMLSMALEKQDRYDEAQAVTQRVIQLRTKDLGPSHPSTALALADFALILHDTGDHVGEERYHRKALQILDATVPPESPDRLKIMGNLAGALTHLDRLSEAEALHRKVLTTYRRVLDPHHPLIGLGINNLAHVLLQEGRNAEAVELFHQALPIMQVAHGPQSQEVSIVLNNLAGTLARLKRYEEADQTLQQAVVVSRKAFGERAVDTGLTLKNYGNLKLKAGHPAQAKPILEESLDILRSKLPEGHVDIAHTEVLLGASLADLGKFAESERLEVEGYTILDQKEAGMKRRTREALGHLVKLYSAWGRPKQAREYKALLDANNSR